MFEGMLDEKLGVYVTTAANAMESSWGTYCPGGQWVRTQLMYLHCLLP